VASEVSESLRRGGGARRSCRPKRSARGGLGEKARGRQRGGVEDGEGVLLIRAQQRLARVKQLEGSLAKTALVRRAKVV
jgi:hypothetical protein